MTRSAASSTCAAPGGDCGDHPYVPESLDLRGYIPNSQNSDTVCAAFCAGALLLVLIASLMSRLRGLSGLSHIAFLWHLVAGTMELPLFGYMVLNFGRLHTLDTWPAQFWKEYAHADSRVLSSECMLTYMSAAISAFLLAPSMLWVALKIFYHGNHIQKTMPCTLLISGAYLCNVLLVVCSALVLPDGLMKEHTHVDFANDMHPYLAHGAAFAFNAHDTLRSLTSSTGRRGRRYVWFYLVSLNALRLLVPTLMAILAPCKLGQCAKSRATAASASPSSLYGQSNSGSNKQKTKKN